MSNMKVVDLKKAMVTHIKMTDNWIKENSIHPTIEAIKEDNKKRRENYNLLCDLASYYQQ